MKYLVEIDIFGILYEYQYLICVLKFCTLCFASVEVLLGLSCTTSVHVSGTSCYDPYHCLGILRRRNSAH